MATEKEAILLVDNMMRVAASLIKSSNGKTSELKATEVTLNSDEIVDGITEDNDACANGDPDDVS